MNERYLFRAKSIVNGEWVEGYYAVAMNFRGIEQHNILIPDNILGFFKWAVVEPSTICQCTGFKDKLNNPIFENDIIKNKYGNIGIVRFGCIERHAGLYIEWIDKESRYFRQNFGYWSYKVEVVGNIFDNLQLLEQEEQHER